MNLYSLSAALFFALCLAATAVLAADVSLYDGGDGRFSVNGAAMDGVAGIDLTIAYNSALLAAPVVTQGGLVSGALMAANTNNPGTIRVAIVNSTKTFTGSGQIIALYFPGRSGSGGITALKAELIDINGAPVQARTVLSPEAPAVTGGAFTNPSGSSPQQSQTTTQTQQPAATDRTTAVTGAAPSIGTLTLPDEGKQPEAPKKQEPPVQEAAQPEQNQPPATTAKAEEPRPVAAMAKTEKKSGDIKKTGYSSVSDRFKDYKGERKIAAFAELFTRPVADEARQEPAIAVSDGQQVVRILIGVSMQDDDAAPNFAASEARVVSLDTEEDSGRWLIDLVPATGTMTASVSILLGNRLFELPVVSIPPSGKLTFTEKEIAAFLKDSGAAKPGFDLNGDDRHDYLDDYIYTGHYLLGGMRPRGQKPN